MLNFCDTNEVTDFLWNQLQLSEAGDSTNGTLNTELMIPLIKTLIWRHLNSVIFSAIRSAKIINYVNFNPYQKRLISGYVILTENWCHMYTRKNQQLRIINPITLRSNAEWRKKKLRKIHRWNMEKNFHYWYLIHENNKIGFGCHASLI